MSCLYVSNVLSCFVQTDVGCIVAASMMHFEKMGILQVMRTLKARRGYVLSNPSFVRQLVELSIKNGYLDDKS